MSVYVVEVKQGVVEASRQGLDWWLTFRARYDRIGRIREITEPCIVSGTAHVACDDREHAEWLAGNMVEHGGISKTAVKVRELRGDGR